jgi:hypothetical protein
VVRRPPPCPTTQPLIPLYPKPVAAKSHLPHTVSGSWIHEAPSSVVRRPPPCPTTQPRAVSWNCTPSSSTARLPTMPFCFGSQRAPPSVDTWGGGRPQRHSTVSWGGEAATSLDR